MKHRSYFRGSCCCWWRKRAAYSWIAKTEETVFECFVTKHSQKKKSESIFSSNTYRVLAIFKIQSRTTFYFRVKLTNNIQQLLQTSLIKPASNRHLTHESALSVSLLFPLFTCLQIRIENSFSDIHQSETFLLTRFSKILHIVLRCCCTRRSWVVWWFRRTDTVCRNSGIINWYVVQCPGAVLGRNLNKAVDYVREIARREW